MVGIRLIVEVLDHAPAELTAQERLLLVAIAEAARDETRTGWPGMEKLTRRTGLGARSVRDILAQLAERGYEVRVSVGTDKNGKPVFAHRGQRTAYQLPHFHLRRQDSATFKAAGSRHLPAEKAAGSGRERRQDPVTKAAESCRPSPQEPSEEPSDPRARADDDTAAVIGALRERTGKTIDEHHAALIVRQLLGDRDDIRDPVRYLAGAIRQDGNPQRFLPTPGPPRYRREDHQ